MYIYTLGFFKQLIVVYISKYVRFGNPYVKQPYQLIDVFVGKWQTVVVAMVTFGCRASCATRWLMQYFGLDFNVLEAKGSGHSVSSRYGRILRRTKRLPSKEYRQNGCSQ